MPATIDTNEQFPAGTTKTQMDAEVALRLKASAISSKYTGSETEGWVLTTTWNVIGEQ
jgi:hypothetical protein